MSDSAPTGDLPERPASALPSPMARALAFAAILVGGTCGFLIAWAVADLQCTGDCALTIGLAGLFGGVFGAAGIAVIAVLTLRAMGEWHSVSDRDLEEPGQR